MPHDEFGIVLVQFSVMIFFVCFWPACLFGKKPFFFLIPARASFAHAAWSTTFSGWFEPGQISLAFACTHTYKPYKIVNDTSHLIHFLCCARRHWQSFIRYSFYDFPKWKWKIQSERLRCARQRCVRAFFVCLIAIFCCRSINFGNGHCEERL